MKCYPELNEHFDNFNSTIPTFFQINSKALYEAFGTLPAAKLRLEAELTKLKIEKAEIMLCNDLPTYQLFEDESQAAALEVKTCMDLIINPPATAAPPQEAAPASSVPQESAPANAVPADKPSNSASDKQEPAPVVIQHNTVPAAEK